MKSKMLLSGFLALLWLAAPAFAREQTPDVDAAVLQWKTAVESGSVEEVMKLYDRKAVMISTFHQLPMTRAGDIAAYYRIVLANPDIHVEVNKTYPRIFGNFAVSSGSYTLSYTQDGEQVAIPARFSFTYILKDGKWIIVDHHSSRVPLADEPK